MTDVRKSGLYSVMKIDKKVLDLLNSRDNIIRQNESSIESIKSDLKEKDNSNKSKDKLISSQKGQIESKDKSIAFLARKIESKDQEIDELLNRASYRRTYPY